jgi:hypothetical protein
MRRIFLAVALAAIVMAAVAATASAQRVTTIRVVATQTSQHRSGHSFIARGRLAEPGNLSDVVGRYQAKFTPRPHHRVRIRGVASFFGQGTLKVKGIEGPRDNRILVIGGTGHFNGAAGKLKTRSLSRRNTLLTFAFVQ